MEGKRRSKLTSKFWAWVTGRMELSSAGMGKAGRGAGFEEKIHRSILNKLRSSYHPSAQTVVLRYHFPGLLIPSLGQEMHQMISEQLETPENKDAIKDSLGSVKRTM